jgi:hypothetical protein
VIVNGQFRFWGAYYVIIGPACPADCAGAQERQLVCAISKRGYRLCPQLRCCAMRTVFIAHVGGARAAQSSLV